MARLISFAKTVEQYEAGTKTETRRDGWKKVKPGDVLRGVSKSPRSGKGWRHLKHAGHDEIVVTEVERVRLGAITPEQVAAEGFPGQTPEWFVQMYCAPGEPDPDREVTRICFLPNDPVVLVKAYNAFELEELRESALVFRQEQWVLEGEEGEEIEISTTKRGLYIRVAFQDGSFRHFGLPATWIARAAIDRKF